MVCFGVCVLLCAGLVGRWKKGRRRRVGWVDQERLPPVHPSPFLPPPPRHAPHGHAHPTPDSGVGTSTHTKGRKERGGRSGQRRAIERWGRRWMMKGKTSGLLCGGERASFLLLLCLPDPPHKVCPWVLSPCPRVARGRRKGVHGVREGWGGRVGGWTASNSPNRLAWRALTQAEKKHKKGRRGGKPLSPTTHHHPAHTHSVLTHSPHPFLPTTDRDSSSHASLFWVPGADALHVSPCLWGGGREPLVHLHAQLQGTFFVWLV